MQKIEISNRHYNGDFGVGSIFEEIFIRNRWKYVLF